MSCLDKIYTKYYRDYQDLQKWAKDRVYTTLRGVKVVVSEFIIPTEPEYFQGGKEIPVMYSPDYLDKRLYKDCPLQFVQDNLRRMYSDEVEVELGKVPAKPEYEPCTKVRVVKKGWSNKAQGCFFVNIFFEHPDYRDYFRYNEDHDFWILPGEDDVWTSSGAHLDVSVKAVIRKILKKWKLPKRCTIVLAGRWVGDDWILRTY